MIKGDMVKCEVEGKTVYGTILYIVDGVASVAFARIGNSECKEVVLPFKLDEIK